MCGSFGMSSITPAVIAIASSILHFLDTNCQPTQTTCVYILRHTQTHRHTGIQAHRHTDKQTHRKHRPRDTQTHRHTGTQTIVNQLKQHVCILVDPPPHTHTHTQNDRLKKRVRSPTGIQWVKNISGLKNGPHTWLRR